MVDGACEKGHEGGGSLHRVDVDLAVGNQRIVAARLRVCQEMRAKGARISRLYVCGQGLVPSEARR